MLGLGIGLLLVSGVFALGSSLDVSNNDKVVVEVQNTPIIVPIVELKSFDVCVEKKNKQPITISKSEPMDMIQISQVVSRKDLNNNKKDCFIVVKETTKLNNRIVKEELKEITKK